MFRLGLCCIFRDEPIKFRTTTATAIKRLSRDQGRKKLADLCAANAAALHGGSAILFGQWHRMFPCQ